MLTSRIRSRIWGQTVTEGGRKQATGTLVRKESKGMMQRCRVFNPIRIWCIYWRIDPHDPSSFSISSNKVSACNYLLLSQLSPQRAASHHTERPSCHPITNYHNACSAVKSCFNRNCFLAFKLPFMRVWVQRTDISWLSTFTLLMLSSNLKREMCWVK